MCNLAELTAGLMVDASLPKGMRWIPKGMQVQYLAKARGTLQAVALPAQPIVVAAEGYALPVTVSVRDRAGTEVFSAVIDMWMSPASRFPRTAQPRGWTRDAVYRLGRRGGARRGRRESVLGGLAAPSMARIPRPASGLGRISAASPRKRERAKSKSDHRPLFPCTQNPRAQRPAVALDLLFFSVGWPRTEPV